MLLSVLGCIDYRINLSKSPMWHDLIGWRKSKGYTLSLLNLILCDNLFSNVVKYEFYTPFLPNLDS